MPKKVVRVTYSCGICGEEYENRKGAIACEKRGVALPEFKCFEVVEIVGLEGKFLEIGPNIKLLVQAGTTAIIQDNAQEDWPDPHLLPEAYDVWLSALDTPNKKVLAHFIPRKYLKRVNVTGGAICPLCNLVSAVGTQEVAYYTYLGLGTRLPILKRVSIRKCGNCNAEFFTKAQSLKVESLVKKRCKWPIAG